MSIIYPHIDGLFPKVLQKVLGLLYSRPDSTFYTNEIIRYTQCGTGSVQRELEKLRMSELITVKSIGNQKHYQANQNSPFFSELRGIVLKSFGLADIVREALQPIIEKIYVAFIYGSIAKQTDTATSDIDLMIISDSLTYGELFKLLEDVQVQLGRIINPTFYSPPEWIRKKMAENNFLKQVISQPKIFLVGGKDELRKLEESGENRSPKN